MKLELQSLGLNTYESAAYTTLVTEGLSTAFVISKKSAVPHGKIYPVLASLEEKGFVKKYSGAPTRFMAIEPKIIIEEVLHRKELELKELKQRSEKLISELSASNVKKPAEPLEKIKVIEGYKNYLNLSVTLHEKAKQEWCSISRIPIYKPHLDAYKKCVKRGVAVKVLTTITDLNKNNLAEWKKTGAEIREIHELPGRFSVMDDNNVVIRISGEGKYLALWIQSHSLAKSSKDYFNFLWKQAKSL